MEDIGGAGLNNIKLQRCHVPQLTPKNEHNDLHNAAQQLEREHAATQKIIFAFFRFFGLLNTATNPKISKDISYLKRVMENHP